MVALLRSGGHERPVGDVSRPLRGAACGCSWSPRRDEPESRFRWQSSPWNCSPSLMPSRPRNSSRSPAVPWRWRWRSLHYPRPSESRRSHDCGRNRREASAAGSHRNRGPDAGRRRPDGSSCRSRRREAAVVGVAGPRLSVRGAVRIFVPHLPGAWRDCPVPGDDRHRGSGGDAAEGFGRDPLSGCGAVRTDGKTAGECTGRRRRRSLGSCGAAEGLVANACYSRRHADRPREARRTIPQTQTPARSVSTPRAVDPPGRRPHVTLGPRRERAIKGVAPPGLRNERRLRPEVSTAR